MGIFAEWQPQYAEHGIATFPVHIEGADKRPGVKGWQRVGRSASEKLAERFRDCNAFGINVTNRFTVLDVDTSDERVLVEALDEFGPTPFIVQSGSGNYQAWYRHGGEKRQIRPDPRKPIDILGDGFVIGAPSLGSKGRYHIIEGDLAALASLPTMAKPAAPPQAPRPQVQDGQRRDALLKFLRPAARQCKTEDELVKAAFDFANASLDRAAGHPFTDADVMREARSVWKWTLAGSNFAGEGRKLVQSHDDLDVMLNLGPDAHFLHSRLRRHNWSGQPFPIANAMADTMPGGEWSLPRLRKARQALEAAGIVRMTRSASTYKGAALYQWCTPEG